MTEIVPVVDSKVVVVIPAYNEERFIGSVVLKLKQYTDTILVIDDGSTDCTAEIAESAGATVIRHEQNSGKGVALNTGFSAAKEFSPTVVITFDGDYQHRAEELMAVAEPVLNGEADIVVGSRYMGDSSDVPVQRVIGHWGFTSLTNVLSGTWLSDSQSGFRAFSANAINAFVFSSSSFSVESEMQFLAKDHRLKVVEVPITISYPDPPKRAVLSHGLIVLNGLIKLVSQHRPLLFFSVSGLGILLLGTILGIWVTYNYDQNEQLAIGTALLVVLMLVVGTSVFITGITLHTIRSLRLEIAQMLEK